MFIDELALLVEGTNVGEGVLNSRSSSRILVDSMTGSKLALAWIVELNVALLKAFRDDIFFEIGVAIVELVGLSLNEELSRPRNLIA